MAIADYYLWMDAAILRQADQLERLTHLAFWQRYAQATDRNGKYLIQKEQELFSKAKTEELVFHRERINDAFSDLNRIRRRVEAYQKERDADARGSEKLSR